VPASNLLEALDFAEKQTPDFDTMLALLGEESVKQDIAQTYEALFRKVTPVADAMSHLKGHIHHFGSFGCLRPLAKRLKIAIDITHERSGTAQIRVISPSLYIHIGVFGPSIVLLASHQLRSVPEQWERLPFIYLSFETELTRVIDALATSLNEMPSFGAAAIIPHSRLKRIIAEATKLDLRIDLWSLLSNLNKEFISKCGEVCQPRAGRLELRCGRSICKDCLMVKVYNQTVNERESVSDTKFQLEADCSVTSEELCFLFPPDVLQALHISPSESPFS
jgi:hypothetical protein